MDTYSKSLIKDCQYWAVYISQDQNYLGRCTIWCKREDATNLTKATDAEQAEYMQIIKALKVAVEKAFGADWINYAFLGNEIQHLHCHFVPRYSEPRSFAGIEFRDDRWGKNYLTDKTFTVPPEVLEKIRLAIQGELLLSD